MRHLVGRMRPPLAAARTVLRSGGPAPGAVVLTYHDVVGPGVAPGPLQVTAAQLRSHIRLLRRAGFTLLTLELLVQRYLAGGPLDRLAALSFDDALVGVYRFGLDVLLEEGAPATILPVTSALGVAPPWWPGSARTMTLPEISDAVRAGIDVAVHTRTHPSLPSLAAASLDNELAGAKTDLEQIVGRPVDVVAYPFGHHDPAVRQAAASAGLRAGFTFLNGRIAGGEDPFKLPRLTAGPALGRLRLSYHVCRPGASWPDASAEVVADGGPR